MSPLQELLGLLDLEPIEVNLFRGRNRYLGSRRVFGGQVLAQALVAAGRTIEEERAAHSLHAYFLLPGDVEVPIVYQVERLRDGGSFSTRRVTAVQRGQPIFFAAVSFQRVETGLEHQSDAPTGVPGPDGLPSETDRARAAGPLLPEAVRAVYTRDQPIEFRPVDPPNPLAPEPRPPVGHTWFRASGPVPDDPLTHQALLAYASDYGPVGAALRPHGRSFLQPDVQAASLDHALWFHRPFRADEWLLYRTESPNASGARGFAHGAIYTAAGRLVASVAQEGLIRVKSAR